MRVILSPAKTMRTPADCIPPQGVPQCAETSDILLGWMRSLGRAGMGRVWKCSDAIADAAWENTCAMNPRAGTTPALFAYDGTAFRHLQPETLSSDGLAWTCEHVRILSGLYGVLRPLDAVSPYRLEMGTRGPIAGVASLYAFWGTRIHDLVADASGVIVNLASTEYSKSVRPHLAPSERMVTCSFVEQDAGGRLVERSAHAKAARGAMVRFLAEKGATDPEEMVDFEELGFHLTEHEPGSDRFVFRLDK